MADIQAALLETADFPGVTGSITFSEGSHIPQKGVTIIEIVDEEAKINPFISKLNELFEQAGSGGLMTMEKVEIIRYLHGPQRG